MSKRFYPETGYMARNGSFWYDHRVMLTVEETDRIEIFRRPYVGKPSLRLGSYGYAQLDAGNPPIGLRQVDAIDGRPSPFTVLVGRSG
ncbi:hypothetical protein [Vineibacter terrae]|uniref:Uncharacterized protein n=1 Tax=Vineibacter terrae TaxID=2586908 RepID=A0A5C8PU38_9HYPH|nr:hypothetical protein [Vineibacter terrae]TXL80481.1 hypothetical protein FHP25_05500 [Vineibacter terrae]HEX2888087.1 hypothetical protein [Vineibacter terrae]